MKEEKSCSENKKVILSGENRKIARRYLFDNTEQKPPGYDRLTILKALATVTDEVAGEHDDED